MEENIFSSKYESYIKDPEIEAHAAPPGDIDKLPRVWVRAAKEGQVVDINNTVCSISKEALESSVGTWKEGKIFDNHSEVRNGFKIYDDRFDSPFLSFLLDQHTANSLKDAEGGSIDGIAEKVEQKRILKLRGVGFSILKKGVTPSCTKDAGCGIAIAGERKGKDVNIKENSSNTYDDLAKIKSEIKQGGNENMADEKPEVVTFSKEQVAEIRAAAVGEATEALSNEHKVAISEMQTAQAAELLKQSETHTAELATEKVAIMKQAAMIESLSTLYGLSDEAKKSLTEAKTLEDALTLFSTLKVATAEPVVAAKGGAQTGSGVVMGATVEAKAPKTSKVEEVGTYNPYTRKYEPTYREEVIE